MVREGRDMTNQTGERLAIKLAEIKARWAETSDKGDFPHDWRQSTPFYATWDGTEWDDEEHDRPAIMHAPTDIAALIEMVEGRDG